MPQFLFEMISGEGELKVGVQPLRFVAGPGQRPLVVDSPACSGAALKNRCTTVVLFCVLWVAVTRNVFAGEAPSGSDTKSDNPQAEFLEAVDKRVRAIDPRPFGFDQLPDVRTVAAILAERAQCRLAVGGKYAKHVFARLRTTRYFGYWITAARKLEGDRVQVLFGTSNPGARSVALLQPYWQPTAAKTENMVRATVERINVLPYTEKAHGFRPGSLTPTITRVLVLLHEQAHLNAAIPDDQGCLAQSMLNTRTIAEACMPEIVLPLVLVAPTDLRAGGACSGQ